MNNAYKILAGESEGKRPRGRPIKTGLKEIARYVGWMKLARDRVQWQALLSTATKRRVL